MPIIRKQLTLFLSDSSSHAIEDIRRRFNPIQYDLIAAHVTLCREDEIEPIHAKLQNIESIRMNRPVTIEFGPAERFAAGKGVLIPAKPGPVEFYELRKRILRLSDVEIHEQIPHITLMHPRNSTCTDAIYDQIREYQLPGILSFDKISLIEQRNGERWKIIRQYSITQNTVS